MARGLSELQQTILKMAYREQHRNQHRWDKFGGVTNKGVLIEFYRFPFHPSAAETTSGTPQIFNRQEIGVSRYLSASVSVTKAFNRLAERGLVQRRYNHGILLTEKGFKIAGVLSRRDVQTIKQGKMSRYTGS